MTGNRRPAAGDQFDSDDKVGKIFIIRLFLFEEWIWTIIMNDRIMGFMTKEQKGYEL